MGQKVLQILLITHIKMIPAMLDDNMSTPLQMNGFDLLCHNEDQYSFFFQRLLDFNLKVSYKRRFFVILNLGPLHFCSDLQLLLHKLLERKIMKKNIYLN